MSYPIFLHFALMEITNPSRRWSWPIDHLTDGKVCAGRTPAPVTRLYRRRGRARCKSLFRCSGGGGGGVRTTVGRGEQGKKGGRAAGKRPSAAAAALSFVVLSPPVLVPVPLSKAQTVHLPFVRPSVRPSARRSAAFIGTGRVIRRIE